MLRFTKSLLLIALFAGLFSVSVNAQVVDSSLVSKGARLYMGGSKLNKEAIAELDGFDMGLYKSGRAKYISGVSLVSVGAVPTLIATYALIGTVIDYSTRDPKMPGSGLGETILLFSGVSALLLEGIGIPLTCVGLRDIRSAVNNYNGNHPVQLSLSPSVDCLYLGDKTQSTVGFYLAFKF